MAKGQGPPGGKLAAGEPHPRRGHEGQHSSAQESVGVTAQESRRIVLIRTGIAGIRAELIDGTQTHSQGVQGRDSQGR